MGGLIAAALAGCAVRGGRAAIGALTLGALAGCARPAPVTGTLADARTGAPVADAEIALAAVPERDGCPATTARTDAAGRFAVEVPCPGAWRVAVAEPGWAAEPVEATAATPAAPIAIRAWRAPEADGVYVLEGTTPSALVTNAGLETLRLPDGTAEVRLPLELPDPLPRLDGERVLLLAGEAAAPLAFAPLVPSGKRWFGAPEAPVPVEPWVYLGVRFVEAPGAPVRVEDVPATPDPAHVVEVVVAGRPLRYVAAGALPPGRYALAAPNARRAVLFEVVPAAGEVPDAGGEAPDAGG